ncbi:MAG: GDP-L-fucose synthase [Cyanobacteria bacterium K_DeepCast_0m_m1_088]|nr:GDP-L-fucose synthase [Cyanobacteria bacterium K_DeepCast_0m_m1_088]
MSGLVAAKISPCDRIYVAGHRGMAGSAICRALARSGYGNILTASRAELDLSDSACVQRWFAEHQPTVAVLAAAKVGGIYANAAYPADFLLENLKIQTSVIEAAWRNGVRRLLFLGSSCIYPKFADQPIHEESLLSGSLEPTNAWYAIAKIAGVNLCEALRKQHAFDAISLMPTNIYGPGDNYHSENSHVMAALIRRFAEAAQRPDQGLATEVTCWGTGTPLREFLHADDLGEACVFVLEHWCPEPDELPYLNVGTGSDLSIRELAGLVAEATGFKGEIRWDTGKPDGTPKKQLDVSRLAAIGWRSRISLPEGIRSTVVDYQRSQTA